MKKNIFLTLLCGILSHIGYSQVTITPSIFDASDQITITVSFASATCNTMTSNPAKVYMHAGIGDDSNAFGFSVVGNWGMDDNVGLMTNNGNGTWSKTITPSTYFNLTPAQQTNATKLGMVFRNAAGTQTLKKPTLCVDFIFNVGAFQLNLTAPSQNSTTILTSGGNLIIEANNTNGNASYNLKSNGVSINTNPATANYSFDHTSITSNQNYELEVTQGATTITRRFTVIVNPGTVTEVLPAGMIDGINYNAQDFSKATLVLNAPLKDFVYVAGNFNNWQPTATSAMKKDPATGKFWIELNDLVASQNYTYQYWVCDQTNLPATSPALVKTADPFSTLVLSNFDDPFISATTYPDLPLYPQGQQREVTVLKTGQVPYDWQVTNFVKPIKDNLVVYEVLVRDFDANRNYQDLIDKIDFFKNLKVNAIQLMPVMEFEGNESWGYNTSFHLANDKFYGPANKLKEFIDLCHQNGIAVILDIALNHAFGRNPMVRMWMKDADGDGWGDPSSENPYFNELATHTYSVGSDFNHSQNITKNYVKRVVRHWIEEYKIDGFRWDLTKGFTQNCTSTNESCTNNFQADRVAILKDYADYSWFGDNSAAPNAWNGDPTHHVIFEHLGSDNEEKEWANYRLNETPTKGIMMWGKMTDQFNQLSMGFNSNNDIGRIGHLAHVGFTGKRVIGYAESHDEERLMYKNIQNGNNSTASHNVRNLNTALSRMSAIGAMSLLVPGPKMIWHFGELGWDLSIFTCNNGVVNTSSDTAPGDCKLDTKPQPQWTNSWLTNTNRVQIYNDWAKMIGLKKNEPIFNKNYSLNSGTTLTPKLYLFDNANSIPATQLKNVVILSNFNVTSQAVTANFPYSGIWYNLMDNTFFTVTNTAMTITIAPGQYKIFGNQLAVLETTDFEPTQKLSLAPNPSYNYFTINSATTNVQIFSITGQLVKTFKSNFTSEAQFDVNDLNKGVYVVKVTDDFNRESTLKLIKQ